MKELIKDWRAKWNISNIGFSIVTLSAYSGSSFVPNIRYSQLSASKLYDIDGLDNVGVSIGLDLYDEGSPCGNVHIRNKTAVS